MRIDQTHIAIRERETLELFDLGLQVVRRHAPAVLVTSAIGAVPFALLNAWLLSGGLLPTIDDSGARYVWNMTLLVFIEAPLATSLTTLYLGQALFTGQPSYRQMLRDLRRMSGQLFLAQGLYRGVVPMVLLMLTVTWTIGMTGQEFFLVCLALYVCAVRGMRPFLNEIVLLEQNPWRKSRRFPMTTGRRSVALHSGSSGELFLGYGLVGACAAAALVASLWMTTWFLRSRLGNVVQFDHAQYIVWLPVAMWLTAAYMTVVRFLTYLDLRIRREGWEVELQMRAVAIEEEEGKLKTLGVPRRSGAAHSSLANDHSER